MKRFLLNLTLIGLLLVLGSGMVAAAPKNGAAFPQNIQLPNGFFPEGIVVGQGHNAYVGSLVNGQLLRINLRSGDIVAQSSVVPGQIAVGLAHDSRTNYVYAAGGPSGNAYIYDGDTLDAVAVINLGPAGFVNDAIVTNEAVFFTDSFAPQIYRLGLVNGEPAGPASTIPLGGDFLFEPGQFNANGIVATADESALIIVNSFFGALYKIDPATGQATAIDLGGVIVNGDGLVLSGKTLYVVEGGLTQVTKIKLNNPITAGNILSVTPVEGAQTPTTAAPFGSSLYIVDARFGTPPGPATTYQLYRISK